MCVCAHNVFESLSLADSIAEQLLIILAFGVP